jgi:hypothetical protein
MSEEKKIENKDESKEVNAVDVNVALVIAERDHLLKVVDEKDKLIEELTKRLGQATDLIEEDSKAALVNKIAPKTTIDKSILSKMSIEKLLQWEKVLDVAQISTIRSGTAFNYDKKPTPRQDIDNMFAKNMAKLRGGN